MQMRADDEVNIFRFQSVLFQDLEQVNLWGHVCLHMAVISFNDLQIFGAGVHQNVLPITLYQKGQIGRVHLDTIVKGECVHGFFIPGHLAQVQRFDGIGWFVHSWPSIHTLSSSTSSK